MSRKIIYIGLLLAWMITSCDKAVSESEEILLPTADSYIKFSTNVASRAPIITDLKDKSFGVIGFTYPEYQNWASARALAKPNLCHALTVNCSADGVCTYDVDNTQNGNQYMLWDLLNNHTFFAYYPHDVTVSDADTYDTPKVRYTLPFFPTTDTEINPDNLKDIMTGFAIDQTVRSGEVDFEFSHRLCCVEVMARNFNDAAQTISNLKVTITGIQYNTIEIPMQKKDSKLSPVSELIDANGAITTTALPGLTFDVSSTETITIAKNESKSVSGDKNLMLIPQENSLQGTVTFIKNGDTANPVTEEFQSEFSFEEGNKYSIVISFTGNDVIVLMVQSGIWDDETINYEFD